MMMLRRDIVICCAVILFSYIRLDLSFHTQLRSSLDIYRKTTTTSSTTTLHVKSISFNNDKGNQHDINEALTIISGYQSVHSIPSNISPVIFHIIVNDTTVELIDALVKETTLSIHYITDLLLYGSVYMAIPNDNYRKDIIELLETSSSIEISNSFIHNRDIFQKYYQSIKRLVSPLYTSKDEGGMMTIARGTYLRLHANPKRFFTPSLISSYEWESRFIYRPNSNLIIMNKYAGMPMVPTVDNYVENTWYQLKTCLGVDDVFVTNRLDTCTEGLTILTTNPQRCSQINKYYSNTIINSKVDKDDDDDDGENSNKSIHKVYKVLTRRQLPLGAMHHLCRRKQSRGVHRNAKPTLLRNGSSIALSSIDLSSPILTDISCNMNVIDAKADNLCFNEKEWQMVQLVVNNCHQVTDDRYDDYLVGLEESQQQHINDNDNDSSAGSITDDVLYESDITLLTGKTHQIRLQLSAIGAPIIGDTRYQPVSGLLDEGDHTEWGNGMQLFGSDPMRWCCSYLNSQ